MYIQGATVNDNQYDGLCNLPKESYFPYLTLWQVDDKGIYFPMYSHVVNLGESELLKSTANSESNIEILPQIMGDTLKTCQNQESYVNMTEREFLSEDKVTEGAQNMDKQEVLYTNNLPNMKTQLKVQNDVEDSMSVQARKKQNKWKTRGSTRREVSQKNYDMMYRWRGVPIKSSKNGRTYGTESVDDTIQQSILQTIQSLPVCRHFVRGFCERGSSCRFQHCMTDIAHQTKTVFLCGLPPHISEISLRKQLYILGFNVLNKRMSLHKSWPCVQLKSAAEAKKLVEKRTFSINGFLVSVRTWQSVVRSKRERVADITRRSIFLGGLGKGTTCRIIRMELEKSGVKVVNLMKIKRGFCPKVTLANTLQTNLLVSKGKIQINGSWVDVRPYKPGNFFTYETYFKDM